MLRSFKDREKVLSYSKDTGASKFENFWKVSKFRRDRFTAGFENFVTYMNFGNIENFVKFRDPILDPPNFMSDKRFTRSKITRYNFF